MLSRLFLISTLLLVGITTLSIGMPVAETNEIIKAVEFPQMRSGNPTLNRRFIVGIPGLPQCPDPEYPQLMSSKCETKLIISSYCYSNDMPPRGPNNNFNICPLNTVCMDFETDIGTHKDPGFQNFAICVDQDFVKSFNNDKKDGVFCKTYKINGSSNNIATLSVLVYDGTQNPARVRQITFSSAGQSGSKQNTYNYSSIINIKNGQTIEACMDVENSGTALYASFTYLDGVYG